MIKLILVDIDGTLLNSNLEVTERTRQAIKRLKEKDIRFGIATGRSPYAVKNLINDWGINDNTDLIVGFNGSAYLDLDTGVMHSHFLLEGQYVKQILEDFKDYDKNAGIYIGETFYCLREDKHAIRIADMNHFSLVVDDLSDYTTKPVNKVLLLGDPEESKKMEEHYNQINPDYKITRSRDTILECINKNLSKSAGIALMLEDMGLTKDEVMTFGDEMNDYEMIRDYVGVAMANGNPEVKAVATYLTDSNDEDGIATFIENRLL